MHSSLCFGSFKINFGILRVLDSFDDTDDDEVDDEEDLRFLAFAVVLLISVLMELLSFGSFIAIGLCSLVEASSFSFKNSFKMGLD